MRHIIVWYIKLQCGGWFNLKNAEILSDIGQKAQFFGLGLLAGKKLRPYAKYFIIGGIALSAAPGIMVAVEQIKQKKARQQEATTEQECCAEVTAETQAEQTECCCEEQTATECCCEEQTEAECCSEEQPEAECTCEAQAQKEEKPE